MTGLPEGLTGPSLYGQTRTETWVLLSGTGPLVGDAKVEVDLLSGDFQLIRAAPGREWGTAPHDIRFPLSRAEATALVEVLLNNLVESKLLALLGRAMAVEREACAKVAESYEPECEACPRGVANAIRGRACPSVPLPELLELLELRGEQP